MERRDPQIPAAERWKFHSDLLKSAALFTVLKAALSLTPQDSVLDFSAKRTYLYCNKSVLEKLKTCDSHIIFNNLKGSLYYISPCYFRSSLQSVESDSPWQRWSFFFNVILSFYIGFSLFQQFLHITNR